MSLGSSLRHRPACPPQAALAADASSLGNLKMRGRQEHARSHQGNGQAVRVAVHARTAQEHARSDHEVRSCWTTPAATWAPTCWTSSSPCRCPGQPGGLSDLIATQLTRQMGMTMPDGTSKPGNRQPQCKPAGHLADQAAPAAPAAFSAKRHARHRSGKSALCSKHAGRRRPRWNRPPASRPASCWARPATRPAGASTRSRHKGGAPSFNLFGIKAGASWTGKVAEVTTTEYVNGVRAKASGQVPRLRLVRRVVQGLRQADFREPALRQGHAANRLGRSAFASGLQKAGYATDPEYAGQAQPRHQHHAAAASGAGLRGPDHGHSQRRHPRTAGQPGGAANGRQQHCQRQHAEGYSRRDGARWQTVQGQFNRRRLMPRPGRQCGSTITRNYDQFLYRNRHSPRPTRQRMQCDGNVPQTVESDISRCTPVHQITRSPFSDVAKAP